MRESVCVSLCVCMHCCGLVSVLLFRFIVRYTIKDFFPHHNFDVLFSFNTLTDTNVCLYNYVLLCFWCWQLNFCRGTRDPFVIVFAGWCFVSEMSLTVFLWLFQVQTRSADEPMTTFVLCNDCGNRWKVGHPPLFLSCHLPLPPTPGLPVMLICLWICWY